MCLGIPARIVSLSEGPEAEIEVGGLRRRVDLTLVPEAEVGDFVLIHAGFAIQRIDEAAAQETLSLMQALADATTGGEP